jgi:hypothetical protein
LVVHVPVDYSLVSPLWIWKFCLFCFDLFQIPKLVKEYKFQ